MYGSLFQKWGLFSGALLVLIIFGGQGCNSFRSEKTSSSQVSSNKFICNGSDSITPSSVRRLPKAHYLNSLKEFLSRLSGPDKDFIFSSLQARVDRLPDDSKIPFSKSDTTLTQSHVDMAFELAFDLGSLLTSSTIYTNQLASVCGADSTQNSLTGACAKNFAAYYLRKIFKRPANPTEIDFFLNDPSSTVPTPLNLTTMDGLTVFLVRLLAHPNSYYIFDNEGTLVSGTEGNPGATYRLNKYEVLAKLTYLYWESSPDDYLFDKIESVDITQPEQVKTLLKYIFNDPKSRRGIRTFYSEWLKVNGMPLLGSANSLAYDEFSKGFNINLPGHNHRADMIQEIADITDYYTFAAEGRYDDLLNTPFSFTRTADMAQIYGINNLWDGTSAPSERFPASEPRSGILTRAAFLATGTEYTNPILKGKKIQSDILCNELPPPPANLDIKPAAQNTSYTTREIVEMATAGTASNPNQCMGCHRLMNPLGFASENFDSLGRFRTAENKFNSSSGAIENSITVRTEGLAVIRNLDTPVNDAVHLSRAIVDSGVGQECMVRKYFRYAYDRMESNFVDGCTMSDMLTNLTNQNNKGINGTNGTLKQLFESAAFQTPFLYRKVK